MKKLIFSIILAAAMLMCCVTFAPASQNIWASWYGPGFHGRLTASGVRYNQYALTAAHKTLPFGTKLRVTYKGKSVIVVINDRGPYIKGRSLDLSKAAAQKIGCVNRGVCLVKIEIL